MTHEELIRAAKQAKERAYVPYSKFPVGAALLLSDGEVILGCNVENAAYGETICAERVAITQAVARGRRDFLQIAIIANTDEYCYPCGACRQVMREFVVDFSLLCARQDGTYVERTLQEMLPYSFGLEK